MPAPPYPPTVIGGQLIASSWGNLVVARLVGHGALIDGLQSGRNGDNTDANGCVWVVMPVAYANANYSIQITSGSTGTATTAYGRILSVVNSQILADRFLVRVFDGVTGAAVLNALAPFHWQTRGTLA